MDDADEFAVGGGTCLRGMASWGLGPAARLAGIGSPSPLHISSAAYAVLLAGKPSSVPRLTVATPLPKLVAALNECQPEALTAYPSLAAMLAEERSSSPPGALARSAWTSWRTRWWSRWSTSAVHDQAGLRVAVVLRPSAPADTPARVRDALARALAEAGAVPPPIEVTPVREIRRDPGHGAKFKLVRSDVPRA